MSDTKVDQIDAPRSAPEDIVSDTSPSQNDSKPKINLNDKEDKEDYWSIWGQLVNDWNNQYKKNTQLVKVF